MKYGMNLFFGLVMELSPHPTPPPPPKKNYTHKQNKEKKQICTKTEIKTTNK
jgi:hypothetical protein